MSKLRSILFKGEMVNAILAGRKTQTRRLVKLPAWASKDWNDFYAVDDEVYTICEDTGCEAIVRAPVQVGDVLWVRETYYAYGKWQKRISVEKQRLEWHFVDLTLRDGELALSYGYDATPESMPETVQKQRREGVVGWWKRPALFMPYVACRLFLLATGSICERLNSITEADAIAEGVAESDPVLGYKTWVNYATNTNPVRSFCDPTNSYRSLWDMINGPESWATNPYVWVYEFEQTDKPA